MFDKLKNAALNGDISALYCLITENPNLLEYIDNIPFTDTPLHVAASAGQTLFALEILSLKPSFGRKLIQNGFSPLHLALQHKHERTVRALIKIDSELVRVKGKEMNTPFHYVTEAENIDLMVDFLQACPSCIDDLTIRCESSVHIAVKMKKVRAFEVLLGWLSLANKEEVLKWKDVNGNTVWHLAASTNQPRVMKLISDKVDIYERNYDGLTALDIVTRLQRELDSREIRTFLLRYKGLIDPSLTDHSIAEQLSLYTSGLKIYGISISRKWGISSDVQNSLVMMAALIATATFLAAISLASGLWSISNNEEIPSAANAIGKASLLSEHALNIAANFWVFLKHCFVYTSSFAASILLIFLVLRARNSLFLKISLGSLSLCYLYLLLLVAIPATVRMVEIVFFAFFILFLLGLFWVSKPRRLNTLYGFKVQ